MRTYFFLLIEQEGTWGGLLSPAETLAEKFVGKKVKKKKKKRKREREWGMKASLPQHAAGSSAEPNEGGGLPLALHFLSHMGMPINSPHHQQLL